MAQWWWYSQSGDYGDDGLDDGLFVVVDENDEHGDYDWLRPGMMVVPDLMLPYCPIGLYGQWFA